MIRKLLSPELAGSLIYPPRKRKQITVQFTIRKNNEEKRKKKQHCQDYTLLLQIKMNAVREIRSVSDISFVLPRLFFFITDCILRNEQCSIICDSHHDHFQTTLRSLPHVFFYF